MAKFGEGDQRWIVRERDDGRNCNNWHWTTKDVSPRVKKTLAEKLQATAFAPPLERCAIKSVDVSGDASINNRKGRTFLIYELEVKLKWEGEVHDADGSCLESCSGSMKLPDVSATMLDDLEVEFTCRTRDGTLPNAMRKQGVAHVKKLIEAAINEMQEEIRAEQQGSPMPAARESSGRSVKPPLPKPISVTAAPETHASAAGITTPAAAVGSSAPPAPRTSADGSRADAGIDDGDGDDDGDGNLDESPPASLAAALRLLRESPGEQKVVQLSNCAIKDCHLKLLIEALHHSQCATEELDLAFNRITDAGIHVLCKALASGCAMELTKIYLGGNKTSVGGMALSQQLKQVRSDLLVDWKQQLRDAQSLCVVGNVYAASPALKAGLVTGDSIIAFGPIQHRGYKSVTESIVPLVKSSVGKPIDVVVVRVGDGAQVHQVQLTLVPQQWSGGGLLGCILK